MARKSVYFKTVLIELHVLYPARRKGGEVFPYHSERSKARATHIQPSSSTTSVAGHGGQKFASLRLLSE
jgi:hypothetical protein